MTSFAPDANRLSYLFDLVQREAEDDISTLSETEQHEVQTIRALLDAIDAAWQAPELDRARVHALFIRKLAAEYPDHPWVQGSLVRTLGELVQVISNDLPALSPQNIAELTRDVTPIESLLDPALRTRLVGQALKRAAVPSPAISSFMLWLNRALADLVKPAQPSQQGLIFTRRQGKHRDGNK
jgi:hypothetical protein